MTDGRAGRPAAPDGDLLVDVRGLTVGYRGETGKTVRIVDDASFHLRRGEALGLAGESGSGKTTTALALLGLLPTGLELLGGEIDLHSRRGLMRVHRRTEAGLRDLRWRTVSVVFQGAMNALDPVVRVGDQLAEAIRLHDPEPDRGEVRARVVELMEMVGIPAARARRHPHEFSGGMRQRIMIALALACRPELVIADEPTTALDVVTQAQILRILEELRQELGLSLILISHDMSVLAETCDRLAIMYGGRIVETGPVADVHRAPAHPYTDRLLGVLPVIGGPRVLAAPIPGAPPDPAALPPGCVFHPRCHRADDDCRTEVPEPRDLGPERQARCLRPIGPAAQGSSPAQDRRETSDGSHTASEASTASHTAQTSQSPGREAAT
ncbi:ABC transporter ATP-binding protein [Streptomyces sp. VNUA24]|uniref:ABC transporter ATP-binding protein n=1 Tax=Streptomyces sp. VNUA24 TaxID=3031131 RepID=UPI0023B77430|nr:ABC transporter ATP-binding protein [Streptomyces sp. VNUA24]WEH12853.1 ABC transporter ATP-binding protein [Streptomyces sp. VNUA24]